MYIYIYREREKERESKRETERRRENERKCVRDTTAGRLAFSWVATKPGGNFSSRSICSMACSHNAHAMSVRALKVDLVPEMVHVWYSLAGLIAKYPQSPSMTYLFGPASG